MLSEADKSWLDEMFGRRLDALERKVDGIDTRLDALQRKVDIIGVHVGSLGSKMDLLITAHPQLKPKAATVDIARKAILKEMGVPEVA